MWAPQVTSFVKFAESAMTWVLVVTIASRAITAMTWPVVAAYKGITIWCDRALEQPTGLGHA